MVSHESNKIVPVGELTEIVRRLRSQGKKIVLCHGVFDLLHIGHIRYFRQARLMGDVLVVTITPDRHVDKGPHRPAFDEALRSEAVASLSYVDYVSINEWPTAEETLRLLRPDFYVKGSEFKVTSSDMTGKIGREEAVAREIGTSLAFTTDIVFSSSNLINRYFLSFPDEVREYLDSFRRRHSLEQLCKTLEDLRTLRVLVAGDTIIDDYHYCEAMGKSSKDPVLAVKYQSHEVFAGGALAIANHVAGFADTVDLATVLGDRESYEDFIRSSLRENVRPRFMMRPNAPTLVKRRYIDSYSLNKLFEIYVMEDSQLPLDLDIDLCEWLAGNVGRYDVIIAADFGHGTLSSDAVTVLTRHSPFLATMTQANAGNRGFHTITRYGRADYVCLAEHEMRLETRDLTGKLRPNMELIGGKLGCSKFCVTRGRRGCVLWDSDERFVQVPSFAQNVVDRVGAGDAFFSLTAIAASQGVDIEILGFLGNVAGSMAVQAIGNQKAIDRLSVIKYVTSLMK